MSSYKIVQLNEKPGRTELMAVPPAWVVGTDSLYLPDSNGGKLLGDPKSAPNAKWKRHKCTLKRWENLPTLLEAMAEIERMEQLSDTADDATDVRKLHGQSRKQPRNKRIVITNADDRRNDFNNMVSIINYNPSVQLAL